MPKEAIPTWAFAVAVIRHGDSYLLVHERKHLQEWYLPAGRVEPGETFVKAAVRETLEESGVEVALDGIIRVEHSVFPDYARMRVIFTGRATGDTTPRKTPNEHSLGAEWVRCGELNFYKLRGDDVREFIQYVDAGKPIYPLSILSKEDAPLV